MSPVGSWRRGALCVIGSDGTVSIVKVVSLSLSSCGKPKSQEGNKSFVPEPRELSVSIVFSDSYVCERFYIFVYFTYSYHGYITYEVNIMLLFSFLQMFHSLWVLFTCNNWWCFTGVRVTLSTLRFEGVSSSWCNG